MEPFLPQWSGSIEGWTVKYINNQLWRMRPLYDFDDLYQECYIYFIDCVKRYVNHPRADRPPVTQAPHFMSLYRITIVNGMNDIATLRTKKHIERSASDFSGYDNQRMAIESIAATQGCLDDLEMQLMLDDAPPVVHELVARQQARVTALQLSKGGMPPCQNYRRKRRSAATGVDPSLRQRETTAEFLNRLLGHVSADAQQQVFDWLQGRVQSA